MRGLQDIRSEIVKLAKFLGRQVSDELIAEIIKMTSYEAMAEAKGKAEGEQAELGTIFKEGTHRYIGIGMCREACVKGTHCPTFQIWTPLHFCYAELF